MLKEPAFEKIAGSGKALMDVSFETILEPGQRYIDWLP